MGCSDTSIVIIVVRVISRATVVLAKPGNALRGHLFEITRRASNGDLRAIGAEEQTAFGRVFWVDQRNTTLTTPGVDRDALPVLGGRAGENLADGAATLAGVGAHGKANGADGRHANEEPGKDGGNDGAHEGSPKELAVVLYRRRVRSGRGW